MQYWRNWWIGNEKKTFENRGLNYCWKQPWFNELEVGMILPLLYWYLFKPRVPCSNCSVNASTKFVQAQSSLQNKFRMNAKITGRIELLRSLMKTQDLKFCSAAPLILTDNKRSTKLIDPVSLAFIFKKVIMRIVGNFENASKTNSETGHVVT